MTTTTSSSPRRPQTQQQQQQADQPQAQQQQQSTPQQQQSADQQATQADQQEQTVADQQEQQQQQQAVAATAGPHQYGGNYSIVIPPQLGRLRPSPRQPRDPLPHLQRHHGAAWSRSTITAALSTALTSPLCPKSPTTKPTSSALTRALASGDRFPTEGGRAFTSTDAAVNIDRQIESVTPPANSTSDSGALHSTSSPRLSIRLTTKLSSSRPTAPTPPTSRLPTWATRS